MMYEMRKRKPENTLLQTQGVFNLPHHIGMVWQKLVFDDVIQSREMDCSSAKCHGNDRIQTPVDKVTNPAP